MTLPETESPPSKATYHQILPDFVLRQFHFVPSSGLRQKIRSSWRTRNVPGEELFLYDLGTGQLHQRPVPKIYGKLDVFKDLKNSTEVGYLESKLKELDDEAAIIVREIHDGLQDGRVKLTRERLSTLRKFLFVTEYRKLAVQFDVEKRGNNTLQYRWLQGLKYYLDTTHHDIIATGERLRERYGNSRLSDMLSGIESYPDGEELDVKYAIGYEGLANYYALGVWVAAEESEFVLCGHSFTHGEGLIDGTTPAHMFHVLTPRIAIILRRTCLLHPTFNDPFLLHSTLADVPIPQPSIQYAKEDLIDLLEANPAQAQLVRNGYRTTPEAGQDTFGYSFTHLTSEQTDAVNEVSLMGANLQYHGSVIFRQPSVMLETLDRYQASPHTSLSGKQKLFSPLLKQLRDPEFQGDSQVRSSSPPDESTADCQLNLLFGSMIKNHITFPSSYTRAFLIFHMITLASPSNPIYQKMFNVQDTAIEKLRCLLDPPLPDALQDNTYSGLVESLANDESEVFFSLIASLLDQANVSIRRSNDFCATVINEAAIIGVTYWLAEERLDVLKDFLSTWVHIWA